MRYFLLYSCFSFNCVVLLHIIIRDIANMKTQNNHLKPQDIVVLLKIIAANDEHLKQIPLAASLGLSQSEISQSIARSMFAGLLMNQGKKVIKSALLEFIQFGIAFAFPEKPGAIVRGIATAHSAAPLAEQIESNEHFVWPHAQGNLRGQAITPLYKSAPEAALRDPKLYELLALTDAIRVGKAREKALAISELKKLIA